ncbi:MAG: hypothetical protein AB1483_10175 [Candidatus Zixiibacteriota bacterium]
MKRLVLLVTLGCLVLPLVSMADGPVENEPGAVFTGVYSDSGVDENNDGYFDYLLVSVEVDVAVAGEYVVSGLLMDEMGREICWRASYANSWVTSTARECGEGTHAFGVRFGGEDIRKSQADGIYQTRLMLGGGSEDVLEVITTPYTHTEFREMPFEILDLVSHQGVDTNGDGLFELIETRVEVSVFRSGLYDMLGRLYGRGIFSEPVSFSDSLVVGMDTLKFELPVRRSEAGKIEGALTFDLKFDNRRELFGGQREYQLCGYSSSHFEP